MTRIVFAAIFCALLLATLVLCGVIGWLIGRSKRVNERLWKKPDGEQI